MWTYEINNVIKSSFSNTKYTVTIHARTKQIDNFIEKAFDENDIVIPFPIRTLDFGIKGGQKLEESLAEHSENQNQEK